MKLFKGQKIWQLFLKFLKFGVLFCWCMDGMDLLMSRAVLTFSQTTNFRLFQTERVCRRQFQLRWKWQKFHQMGRKHCGKRRNCSSRAISPFPTVFSKGFYCRHVKRIKRKLNASAKRVDTDQPTWSAQADLNRYSLLFFLKNVLLSTLFLCIITDYGTFLNNNQSSALI